MTESTRQCRTIGCDGESDDGPYCPACRIPGGKPREGRSIYNSKRWKAKRTRFMAAHPCCQWPLCSEPANQLDHMLPVHLGGNEDESNLQALCRRHHTIKTRAIDPRLRPTDTPASTRAKQSEWQHANAISDHNH